MKRQWRVVRRGDVTGQWASFYVTLNRKGHIVMSRLTHERLGKPRAVQVLFDPPSSCIGLKPTQPALRDTFLVGPSGRHGGKIVRAYRLLQEFSINVKDTIRFRDAEFDADGVLVLELRTAEISARAKAQRVRREKSADCANINKNRDEKDNTERSVPGLPGGGSDGASAGVDGA